jgi:hypothetical protein
MTDKDSRTTAHDGESSAKDENQGPIGRFFGRLAVEGVKKALAPEDPDDNKSGLLGKFMAKITTAAGTAIENQEDSIIEQGAERVGQEIKYVAQSVGEQVKRHTGAFFQHAKDTLNPTEYTNWEIVRNKIAPEKKFFKTVYARILHVGCYISSFVGDGISHLLGNVEDEFEQTNRYNIESVLVSLITLFKLPEEEDDDEKKRRKKRRKAAGDQLKAVLEPEKHVNWDDSPVPVPAPVPA